MLTFMFVISLLISATLIVFGFYELYDGAGMIISIISLMLTAAIGLNCLYDYDIKKHLIHSETAKNGMKITIVEQRQKLVDVHQKFLHVVKDDPDFKIYFEND